MLFKEFGRKDGKVIVLLHGGGLSWWAWKDVINLLKADYCVVCPVIDGHGEDSSNTFISIENSASKLIAMIDEIHGGRVHALCGVSLGAQIVCEALAQKSNVADFAVIESAVVIPSKLTAGIIIPAYKETRTIKKSAKLLYEVIQDSTVYEAKEYQHGEFSLSHPEEYVQRLRTLVNIDKSPR